MTVGNFANQNCSILWRKPRLIWRNIFAWSRSYFVVVSSHMDNKVVYFKLEPSIDTTLSIVWSFLKTIENVVNVVTLMYHLLDVCSFSLLGYFDWYKIILVEPETWQMFHEEFQPPAEGCYTGLQNRNKVKAVLDVSNDREQAQIR